MKLPIWLYFSRETAGILRTHCFGSRRTGLYLLVMSMRRGPTVWMLCLRGGLCLTIGPEDAVAEGLIDAREACPRLRHRTWRRLNGRAYQLSYDPSPGAVA